MDIIEYFNDWFAEHVTMFILFVVPSLLLFWLAEKQILPLLIKSIERRKKVRHQLYQVKVIFWIVTFLVYLVYHAKESSWATFIPLALVLALVYSQWSNWLAGILLRFEGKYNMGDRLRITLDQQEVEGEIKHFKSTKLQLEDNDGNLYEVPYQEVHKKLTFIPNPSGFMVLDELILPVSKENYPAAEVQVRSYLAKSPWILSSKGIDITYKDQFIHIQFQLLEKSAKPKIKHEIQSLLDASPSFN